MVRRHGRRRHAPVGAGRTTVTAAGGLAGLLLGATLVFVLHAPRPEPTPTVVNRTPASTPAARPTPAATGNIAAAAKAPAVDPRMRREAIPLTTVSTIVTPQVRSVGA